MSEPVTIGDAEGVLDGLLTPMLAWNFAREPGRPKKARLAATRELVQAVHDAAARLALLAQSEKERNPS